MDTFLETIWFSKKRKSLLFLLLQGPKTAIEIESTLKLSWKSLLLPIKELKEMDLVVHTDDVYLLTNIGKLLAKNAKSVSDLIDLLDNNLDYWETRDLENIPDKFLKQMDHLKILSIIEPGLREMFELSSDITIALEKAINITAILSFFHPSYFSIFKDSTLKKVNLSLIITKGVLNRIETDFKEELNELKQYKNIEIFIYQDEFLPPTLILTDSILILSIFEKTGLYDHKDILSFDPQSFEWAKELYLHYLFSSKKLV